MRRLTGWLLLCGVCLVSTGIVRGFEGESGRAGRFGHRLILMTQDTFGLSPRQLKVARTTVDALLERLSIEVEWHTCSAPVASEGVIDPLCFAPLADGVLVVRVAAATKALPAQSLGNALVNGQQGSLATVFADRVEALAARARVDPGLLLGRVIAHEVGHLLIGSTVHRRGGLMRGQWSVDQLRRDIPVDWIWSPEDIVAVTQNIDARTGTLVSGHAGSLRFR